MVYNELISNANFAFGGGQYENCLNYAKEAIQLEPKKTEGYFAAGKACMSMSDFKAAIDYFQKAIDIDKKNGDGYFLLGYANAMAGNIVEALKSLTRAIENNCDETLKGQIYKIMSMINTDQGDFDNALLNIDQAEQYIGLDYELLQQKAACYASLKDYHSTIFTLNQMKLLKPNEYSAYSLAFHVFMELGIYDEAKAELERAEEFADLTMTYYNDKIAFALMNNAKDETPETISQRWKNVLQEIDVALKKGNPDSEQVFEMYLRAAQMYLSLEQPDKSLRCLDAAGDPVFSYNNKFSVLLSEENEVSVLTTDVLTPEEEEEIMQEKWDNGDFDEISEKIEEALDNIDDDDPEAMAEAVQKYLSPLEKIPESNGGNNQSVHILMGSFDMDQIQRDMRNAMYISVYEMKKDYDNMLNKARELQASNIVGNQYSGIYYELKVGKYKNEASWRTKYRDRINFWTRKMLEDPTDYMSASYRIRSYIDIEDFENAEQLCSCMPADIKEALMEEIQTAKAKGGGDNGNTSE